jgi:hypothetical protein
MSDGPTKMTTEERYERRWASYIVYEKGMTSDSWWFGWCPLHDKDRADPSAQFNFKKGSMRCLNLQSEDLKSSPCHPGKRGMSLDNLTSRLLEMASNVE